MALFAQARRALIGDRVDLDRFALNLHPELSGVRFRRGGLPPRIGGWFLGARTVDGITLGSTVWVAPRVELTAALLLHELQHVRQWRSVSWFALRYVWESLRRGYHNNRFEVEACDFARASLAARKGGPLGVEAKS